MPRQAVETLRDRVIREARQSYVAAGRPPVLVSVLFNSSAGFGKSDVSRLASKLFELVLRNFPEADSRTEEEYDWLQFPQKTLEHVYSSPFSQAYLLEPFSSRVHPLKSRPVLQNLTSNR